MLHVLRRSDARWRIAATILAVTGALALAGCGKKADTAVVGQVVAHVGPDDVTQQEVDNELRLANVPADKRTDDVVKAILTRILERKYLVQQAIAAKIDREPTIHLDLMRARENILAGAFAQREVGQKATAISKSEVDGYIQGHPDQFDRRRIFEIEQVSFAPIKDMEGLAAATKDYKTIDQVEAKLNQLGIKYSRGPAALDSATMPEQMLKTLDARKPDDVFFVRSRSNASFFKVASVDNKPLTGDEAQALGKRELAQELLKKTAEDTSRAAVASTKFEGDYNRIMSAATPAAPAPAADAAPAAGEAAPAIATPGTEPQKDAPKN
ncbi:EpsD family peptidyl-prolyl cis-trans isomerase [Roseiarcus fermentans]|uniref:EpsD family peptidyl-prolyl cis-trans isomerase n=1 Tax=Roseiarcus fermentans TaxID=1473586 RepID=A0A366F7K1_9HYPH|nr:EpsD family peptidyl-prolyl cis-trans isomerase [Roseiarcus fermentans]RBP10624.1 EpsD family peptidyl-prolyl cis-trans isomerase [Roseiarcus fermentans]